MIGARLYKTVDGGKILPFNPESTKDHEERQLSDRQLVDAVRRARRSPRFRDPEVGVDKTGEKR